MAIYVLDSSALVKRYVQETGTHWVRSLASPGVRTFCTLLISRQWKRSRQSRGAPSAATLVRWNDQVVAIHFPDHVTGGIREHDNESLDPEDYPADRGMKAVRALRRLADGGGYVLAQYHGHDDYLVGLVSAKMLIKLIRGTRGNIWGNQDRPEVIKSVSLQQVRVINARHHPALAQALLHRPRRGTLRRWWQDGNAVRDIVEA